MNTSTLGAIIAWLKAPAKQYIEIVKLDNSVIKFARYVPDTPRWKIFSKSGKVYVRLLSNKMTDYEYFCDF